MTWIVFKFVTFKLNTSKAFGRYYKKNNLLHGCYMPFLTGFSLILFCVFAKRSVGAGLS
jgi:hypothetical protein